MTSKTDQGIRGTAPTQSKYDGMPGYDWVPDAAAPAVQEQQFDVETWNAMHDNTHEGGASEPVREPLWEDATQ